MSSKRKFDYIEFMDGYGVLFDADKYSKQDSIDIYMKEFGDRVEYDVNNLVIGTDYVKWYPKMSEEDMWYLDIYDKRDNRGIYKCCKPTDSRCFKVWRLRTLEEEKLHEKDEK